MLIIVDSPPYEISRVERKQAGELGWTRVKFSERVTIQNRTLAGK